MVDHDPVISAQMQCNKHVVKMILELAQMLSTAHRVLDGSVSIGQTKTGRKRKVYKHPNPQKDAILYQATHINHPCSIWVRDGKEHYQWAYDHFCGLCDEYSFRYGKIHKTDYLLREMLQSIPVNMPETSIYYPLAMPDEFINHSKYVKEQKEAVKCYREYYISKQHYFKMEWTNRQKPEWFA